MFIVLGVIFNLLVGLYWICLTRKSEGNPLPIPTDQRSFIISLSPPPLLLFAPLQLPTRDWRPLRPRHFSEKAETVQVHVTLDSEGPRAKEIPHRAMKHLHAFLLHGGLWILVFHGLAEGGQTRIPANQGQNQRPYTCGSVVFGWESEGPHMARWLVCEVALRVVSSVSLDANCKQHV